jgi:hypothetical protein
MEKTCAVVRAETVESQRQVPAARCRRLKRMYVGSRIRRRPNGALPGHGWQLVEQTRRFLPATQLARMLLC